MAAVFGSISEFVFETEDITEWIERLEQWFIANGLENNEERKKALLLSNVGARGYKLIRSLAQNKPTEKSYKELKDLMVEHLNPKPNEIAQRYVFYKRDRRNGETVKDYVAALRKLSEHCNFAEKLEDHLRDRFVCGLNDEKVQQKLLATQNLTLKNAVDNAVAMEAAVRSAKQIHGVEVSNIHKLGGGGHSGTGYRNKFGGKGKGGNFLSKGNNQKNNNRRECYRCGSLAHLADKCPFIDRVCYGCKKKGHAKSKCRAQGVNYEGVVVDQEDEDELEEGIYALNLYRFSVVSEESDEEFCQDSELCEEGLEEFSEESENMRAKDDEVQEISQFVDREEIIELVELPLEVQECELVVVEEIIEVVEIPVEVEKSEISAAEVRREENVIEVTIVETSELKQIEKYHAEPVVEKKRS